MGNRITREQLETVKSLPNARWKPIGVVAVTQESASAAEEVTASAEQLSASNEEVASASQDLEKMALRLQQLVNKFKTQ